MIAAAAVLFAIVLALKLAVRTPGFGFPLLYDIPVALVAVTLGARAGLAAAAVAMVFYAIGDAAAEIQSNAAGYASRAVTFFLLGGVLGLYSDRLRRAQTAVGESEAHFRAALEDAPVAVWEQDRDLRYTWVHNPASVLGADDILGGTDAELAPPEAATRLTEVKREVLRSGHGQRIELQVRDGRKPQYVDFSVNPLRDPEGEVAGIAGAATDITELKRAEAELRSSRALLSKSQEMAKLGSWEWDIPTDELTWSDEMHSLYGTSPDEFEASYAAFLDKVHPDDRQMVEEAVGKAYETGGIFEFDHRIVRPDGGVLVLHAHGEVTLGDDGKPVRMAGTGQDISERRQVEHVLGQLAAIVEQSEDAIVAKDTEGFIREWNRGAENLYGYPAHEAIGQPISILIPEEHAAEEKEIRARVLEGEAVRHHETVRRRKDGTKVEVWTTLSPVRNASGSIVGVSSIARDITALKEVQRDLERSNAELEQFAYVASHDLSEPLRTISGFVQLLARRYEGRLGEDADEFIAHTVDGVNRMQSLIDGLLTYSRAGQRPLELESVDCSELVGRVVQSLGPLVRESEAEIVVEPLPTIQADRTQLYQVLQNLISNAVKFHEGAPRVEVSANSLGDGWKFSVADDGIGIEPEHAERIFEMFQRLHSRQEFTGTGIGLALCKRIVERHGGRIWFQSRPEGGTVFHFTIATGSREQAA